MVGRFPVCFLHLDMPAQLVDVNVHPTKLEVRFQEGGKIYSQLLQTLRHRFLSTDLTARVRHADLQQAQPSMMPSSSSENTFVPPSTRDDDRWEAHATRMTAAGLGSASGAGISAGSNNTSAASPAVGTTRLPFSTELPEFRPFPTPNNLASLAQSPFGAASGTSVGAPWNPNRNTDATSLATTSAMPEAIYPPDDDIPTSAAGTGVAAQPTRADGPHLQPAHSHLGFQIHNRYLVTQDDQGMVVVDQHALHERILYEQLRKKMDQGQLESQQLLVPEPLDLTPAEAAAALDSRELLAKIGINVEPFGGDTVLMTSYPAMLANMRPAEMLRQVLQPLMEGGKEPSTRDLMDDLLNMIACKAAIKAGDRLSPEEITSLLEQRYHYQDTHHCPHGRPTALFFSRDQLDKMFKRT